MSTPDAEFGEELQGLFAKAVEYFEAGDPIAARTILQRLLASMSDQPYLLNYLGTTSYMAGDLAMAREYFEQAVGVDPDFDEGWRNLGSLSIKIDDAPRAIAAFRKLCEITPQDPQAFTWLGDSLQIQDLCADAIGAYERALQLDPLLTETWVNMARALLFEGRWDAALEATRRASSLLPGHTGALALRSVALAELQQRAEWRELVDFDRLIEAFPIKAPAGFMDLAAFNRALADYCLGHPSLTFNPARKSTEMGYQTKNLPVDEQPVRDLVAVIGACVEAYVKSRPIVPGHPFLGQRPEGWKIAIWGTVLVREGHQNPHVHRDGWLSGVYYVEVPDVLRHSDDEKAGWIEFGRPQQYSRAKATPTVRQYQPSEGTLYLFPSYFYHRTIPFHADLQRISIAFDLIPATSK